MTIEELQEEIINEFKSFDNEMERYNYLIKLGRNLSPMDPKYKTKENIIKGCLVKTWYHSILRDGKLFFHMDSLSAITRGFIALLLRVFSGQKPEDIKNANLYFIDEIGVREHFSPLRANSLFKLVSRIKPNKIK